jgi:hypothetical protein
LYKTTLLFPKNGLTNGILKLAAIGKEIRKLDIIKIYMMKKHVIQPSLVFQYYIIENSHTPGVRRSKISVPLVG